MALLHNLIFPSPLFFFLFFLLSSVLTPLQIHVRAQQPYGKEIDDCTNNHNSTAMLGYFCGSSPSCQSFLTFTSMAPYSNLSSIAALLGTSTTTLAAANDVGATTTLPEKTTVLVPAICGCTSTTEGNFYQHNATANYVVKLGDTLQLIAKGTFQGLTTCQALEAQALHGAPPASLLAGEVLPVVPLRCACPTAAQVAGGVRFLVTYLVAEFDDVSTVAGRFGVDVEAVTAANELQAPYTIFPSTTLLIPVTSQPNVAMIQSPPAPPPATTTVVAPPPGKKRSNHVGVYIGVAVAVVAVIAIAFAGAFLVLKAKRKRKLAGIVLAAGELPKKKGKGSDTNTDTTSSAFTAGGEFSLSTSSAFTSISVTDIKSSLRVYTYAELKSATDDFSHGHHIGGSVYRAEFAGDVAAVEVVDRNVSTEVEIMRKINHLNLIRLIGLCHHHGRWFLVTEFADHGSLRDRLLLSAAGDGASPPALTWEQRMQIALDVAEGLRYLHEYARPKCVHMDVSSGSVLLAGDGHGHLRGKLRSFGAARVITGATAGDEGGEDEEEAMFTMTSRIAGTRGYIAQEYLEHGVVSAKADVYSLGVVLMELLTGKDADELVGDGVGDPFVGLREMVEELDGGGDAVMERLEELVDPAMPAGSCPVDGVVMMVRLIERCVRRNAAGRPTAGEVARWLLKMKGVEVVVSRRSSPESPRSPGK